jgi:hypothetical protein
MYTSMKTFVDDIHATVNNAVSADLLRLTASSSLPVRCSASLNFALAHAHAWTRFTGRSGDDFSNSHILAM